MFEFQELKEPYLIGEIGINHNGDLQICKKLIDGVFANSWNCVKFQKRNPDLSVPENQKKKMRDTIWGRMTYLEYKYRIEFGFEEYVYIDKYCRQKPVDWTASVWDMDSLEFITQFDVPFIKIPSAMLSNLELIMETARTNIPLMVSTGMSTLEEIDEAVSAILKYGKPPIIMHCNSSYPTPREELNLNIIPVLVNRYPESIIGYSGHDGNDFEPTILAVALGAGVVERHITLSNEMWGTDQKASLEVGNMALLKEKLKDIGTMLGSAEKVVTRSEISVKEKLRGIYKFQPPVLKENFMFGK